MTLFIAEDQHSTRYMYMLNPCWGPVTLSFHWGGSPLTGLQKEKNYFFRNPPDAI